MFNASYCPRFFVALNCSFEAAVSIVGFVVSFSIVNVAVVELRTQSSVVNAGRSSDDPVAPQSSLKATKSLLQVTPLHVVSWRMHLRYSQASRIQRVHVAHTVALNGLSSKPPCPSLGS